MADEQYITEIRQLMQINDISRLAMYGQDAFNNASHNVRPSRTGWGQIPKHFVLFDIVSASRS
jgi:hypothetical protein